MTKTNRMNRSPTSRATLRELERKGVLRRQRVGIRNIIRADGGEVETIGFDVNELHGSNWKNPALANFTAAWPSEAWVGYNGGRARLIATQPYSLTPTEKLMGFPVNEVAAALLKQPCTKGSGLDSGRPFSVTPFWSPM
jgi:hypothetical protein